MVLPLKKRKSEKSEGLTVFISLDPWQRNVMEMSISVVTTMISCEQRRWYLLWEKLRSEEFEEMYLAGLVSAKNDER